MTFGCEKQSFSSERLQCFEETLDQTIAMIRMVANIVYKYNQSQGFNIRISITFYIIILVLF